MTRSQYKLLCGDGVYLSIFHSRLSFAGAAILRGDFCAAARLVRQRRRAQFPFNDVKSIIVSISLRIYPHAIHMPVAGILKRSHSSGGVWCWCFPFPFGLIVSAWLAKCFSERNITPCKCHVSMPWHGVRPRVNADWMLMTRISKRSV